MKKTLRTIILSGFFIVAVVALVSSCKKKEEVKDTDAPVITLLGDAFVTTSLNAVYTDLGATAMDNKDGDISSAITFSSSVNRDSTGTYTITYSVSDAAGNAATTVTRTVRVKNDAETLAGEDVGMQAEFRLVDADQRWR